MTGDARARVRPNPLGVCPICGRSIPWAAHTNSVAAHQQQGGSPCPGGGNELSLVALQEFRPDCGSVRPKSQPARAPRGAAENGEFGAELADAQRFLSQVAEDIALVEKQSRQPRGHDVITRGMFNDWRTWVFSRLQRCRKIAPPTGRLTPKLERDLATVRHSAQSLERRIFAVRPTWLPESPQPHPEADRPPFGAQLPSRPLRRLPFGPVCADYYMDPTNSK